MTTTMDNDGQPTNWDQKNSLMPLAHVSQKDYVCGAQKQDVNFGPAVEVHNNFKE